MAHTFEHTLDAWATNGTKSAPSSTLKSTGFVGGMKPPASVFNYQWDKIAKAISELQQYALTEDPSGGIWQNLAAVATSGSYNDLLNKPAFKAVATSGDYADLINKPIAAGSYVGDKTGTAYLTDRLTVQRYSPRTISLPFTPNVILLIEKSTDSVTVIAPAVAKYASVQYYRTSAPSTFVNDVSAPINLAYIDGNSLSLIGTIAAGTTISRIQKWYGFFDSASEATSVYEGGSFNESGYTYYYLAF